jgi:integrase
MRTTTRDRNGSVALGRRTKTGAGRELVLLPDVVASLRGQRVKVAEAQLKAGRLWVDYDLVFPSSVGTPQDARNLRRDLRPLATAAGFPGSFHSLRHYYASVALSAVPEASVSKVLGHAKRATTTDVYGHLRESDAGMVAVAVSVAVKRGRAAL